MTTKILAATALVFLLSCSHGPDIAGSGSESPNALTGTALMNPNPDGASIFIPAESASVQLYAITLTPLDSGKVDYTWSLRYSSTTDINGNFRFDSIQPGYYSLIAERQNKKAFSGYFRFREDDSVVRLGYLELKNTQNIQGVIHDTLQPSPQRFLLGMVGTPFIDTVENSGQFNFSNIPDGYFNFKIISCLPGTYSPVDTTNSVFFVWNSTTITLDFSYSVRSADTLGASDSLFTVPWMMGALQSSVLISADTVKMNIDSYEIKYTSTQNP